MGLNEADTRAKLIDPAIHARGWTEEFIFREQTAPPIEIINGKARKHGKGRTDYTLRIKVGQSIQPVAVALIEAKAEDLPPTHGLEQVKQYAAAKRLNVPFVYSTNGHLFVEYNNFTGLTSSPKPLSQFPSPEEVQRKFELGMGFSLSDTAARPLLIPYAGGEGSRRYYQDAAIRAVIEKIARCEHTGEPKRALLSLATGAGKTLIAVNYLKKVADAGQLRRALFLCDRDELRTQGLGAFQNIFGNDAAEVFTENDGSNHAKNARVHIGTYQTLDVDSEDGSANFLTNNYPENHFSHIIIDECHRSAWGKWSQVLTRNPNAVEIGLTATPREIEFTKETAEAKMDAQITADNVAYFGEPVYEYSLSQGIEDGYLAACEIHEGRVNLDDQGLTIDQIYARHPINAVTGQPVTYDELKDLYSKTDYEKKILLPDRVYSMCQDLFKYLLETGGPEQKTIIFCVRDYHADAVAIEMNNLYAQWCRENGKQRSDVYAFKCTASVQGSNYLPDLKGASKSHFIATTVDLLTTGVDVPCVRNIVFFKYVRSPIAFYQMMGRGTRLDPATNKLMFRVYDYTNATDLLGASFKTKFTPIREPKDPGSGSGGSQDPIISVEGFDVTVSDDGTFILTQVDGVTQKMPIERYKERLANKLIAELPTIEQFRARWINPIEREKILLNLPDGERSVLLIQQIEEMNDYDLFDVLGELGYGLSPLRRAERAISFRQKHQRWLASLPKDTAETILALVDLFAGSGTDGLEDAHLFEMQSIIQAGGLGALKRIGKPADILRDAKERIFA
jgi:type I restriction enzyme R subunit